jgi:hypothetical protein
MATSLAKRLDALTERHIALSNTVELIAGMQLQTEVELGRLARYVNSIAKKHDERITKLEKRK